MTETSLLQRAKALRKEQTPAEQKLWSVLRNRLLAGLKFYRQRVIGPYIADFYCPALKLVVEVDGAVHFTEEQQAHDARRTAWLEAEGFRVLRVTNDEVFHNVDGVAEAILRCDLTPTLSGNDLSPALSLKGEGVEELNPLPAIDNHKTPLPTVDIPKNPLPLGEGRVRAKQQDGEG